MGSPIAIERYESACPDCRAQLFVQGERRGASFIPRQVMHKVPACLAYARANKALEEGNRDPNTLVFLQKCVRNMRGKPLEPAGLDG